MLLLSIIPVSLAQDLDSRINDSQLECLARNIYYEARGEGIKGMLAVGQVTINRVNSGRFPDTICEVVHQKAQFSWTSMKLKQPHGKKWYLALWLAGDVLSGKHALANFKALYFHSKEVSPAWGRKMIAQIGNHIFYI